MDEFKRETSIFDGRGESEPVGSSDWDESKHPRDEDGKFTEKGTGTAKSGEKEKSIQNLVNALKQVKKIKMKELVEMIKNFDPISLKIKDDEIIAEFDKFTANKNIYGHGNSDVDGYNYKTENVDKLPEIIRNTKYSYSKNEIGKNTPQHKGVLRWHYFTGEFETEKGMFKVVVNVRDKGDKQYIYEVAIKKKT